jgi:hypothetical protein
VQHVVRIRGDDGFRLKHVPHRPAQRPRYLESRPMRLDRRRSRPTRSTSSPTAASSSPAHSSTSCARPRSRSRAVLDLPHGTLHVVRVFNDPAGPLDNPNALPRRASLTCGATAPTPPATDN